MAIFSPDFRLLGSRVEVVQPYLVQVVRVVEVVGDVPVLAVVVGAVRGVSEILFRFVVLDFRLEELRHVDEDGEDKDGDQVLGHATPHRVHVIHRLQNKQTN